MGIPARALNLAKRSLARAVKLTKGFECVKRLLWLAKSVANCRKRRDHRLGIAEKRTACHALRIKLNQRCRGKRRALNRRLRLKDRPLQIPDVIGRQSRVKIKSRKGFSIGVSPFSDDYFSRIKALIFDICVRLTHLAGKLERVALKERKRNKIERNLALSAKSYKFPRRIVKAAEKHAADLKIRIKHLDG